MTRATPDLATTQGEPAPYRWAASDRQRPSVCVAALLIAVTLALSALPAAAQVNTESIWAADTEGFDGEASLDLVLRTGNTDLSLFGTRLRLQYAPLPGGTGASPEPPLDAAEATAAEVMAEPSGTAAALGPRNVYVVFGRFERGESQGNRISSQGFLYGTWVRMVNPLWGWGLVAQHQFDELALLDQRSLVGALLRTVRDPRPWLQFQARVGYMFEYEKIDVPVGAPDQPTTSNHRLLSSLVAGITRGADDRLRLINTLYFQPRLDDPGDLRILDELEVQVRVSDRVSLGLSGSVRYDSRPPTGVESTDVALVHRLSLRF